LAGSIHGLTDFTIPELAALTKANYEKYWTKELIPWPLSELGTSTNVDLFRYLFTSHGPVFLQDLRFS
jgi:hypothetical protein